MALIIIALIIISMSWFISIGYETISFYWLSPRRIKKIMEKQGVKGPIPRPFVGNLLDMSSLITSSTSSDMPTISHDIVPRLLPHHLLWTQKYGKIYVYWHGYELRMCLTDSKMIKEFLTKYNMMSGRSWLQLQGNKKFIGSGLLMVNGDAWYHQRNMASPAFMSDKLKIYAGYVAECTNRMLQSLRNFINIGENEFEISELMKNLTADVISWIEFGDDHEKGKKIFHNINILQPFTAQASKHLCYPGNRFLPCKYNKEMKTLNGETEGLLKDIIENRKRRVETGKSDSYGNDLLGNLMNELEKDNKDGCNLHLQLIIDECKTFFFAGHESTALLLTWTVLLLASNQDWQNKLRDEIAIVCNGSTPSLDHLPKLCLLTMIINESLRLYPPVTILPRMAFEDIKLGDLYIPKGLSIWIPVLAIHHDPELWGNDVNEFNPERFASKSFVSSRFMPFGGGPRNCIGQSFALMEAKIILAMLVSKFRITVSNNYRHSPTVVLTIKPKHGVQVCMEPL